MNMKLCPKCELNLILDDKETLCPVCKNQELELRHSSRKTRLSVLFNEYFTFSNEQNIFRSKRGFQAYNAKGENVGIVFMTDDKDTPAYQHCELCFYPEYQNKYGEWHRFTSLGQRVKWEFLRNQLEKNKEYKCFID